MLPESTDELLMLRPVGGLDEEVTGVLPAVEAVAPATFRLPGREDLGDFASGRLLRDAARLSTRAAAGPFRSFGRIAVEPRPYQLVPLMMALELDPVRLLVADDVGIGKTVEACLIARELLDRGEIRRIAVLCPPHLAEQWQRELAEKFHLEAELVLSSTIQRLERDLPLGVSVFERHPVTVVSTDFIKAARRAEDFALKCPELVIVDEAHGCTLAGGSRSDSGATGGTSGTTSGATGRTGSDRRGQRGRRGRQQRHDLLRRLAADPERHLVLVTATPHSGNEEAFRSLLGLLEDGFADLPADLDRAEREGVRRRLARHLVQRRRGDVRRYLETDTAFPERRDKEATYTFSPAYRRLFDDVLAFAREYVSEDGGGRRRQRVRYWSALALLRCVSSSPAAAVATLCSRAAADQAEDEEDADEVGRRSVLDQGDDDDTVPLDLSPGSDTEDGRPGDPPQAAGARPPRRGRRPRGGPQASGRGARGQGVPEGRLPSGGLLPLRRYRGLRRTPSARRAPGTGPRRIGHRPASSRRTRGAHRFPRRRRRPLRARLHRLPVGGHQPPGALRCRPALRPGVEPHAPRAARRPGGPLRAGEARGAGRHVLRRRQTRSTG